LDLIIAEVSDLLVENNIIKGVILSDQKIIYANYVIITTGTYLKSITHRGSVCVDEGADGTKNAKFLSDALVKLGFKLIRLKTGTPARIKKDSIDFTNMILEPGTNQKIAFSHYHPVYKPYDEQLPCHIIYTNEQTHQIIRENLNKSAMYGGMISGIGPRYCPSIEDKIVKFSEKPRHQIFVEPESYELDSMYLGGFSTSMPIDVQEKMIRSLPGL